MRVIDREERKPWSQVRVTRVIKEEKGDENKKDRLITDEKRTETIPHRLHQLLSDTWNHGCLTLMRKVYS